MLQRLIGEDIDLAVILDPGLSSVNADSGQLNQVLVNLAVNARDAMPKGGKLTIETHNVFRETEDVGNHGIPPGGHYAMIAITDTGIGMDRETQSHIFEPFFTTKESGKGTGLGLATVHGIVQQHGGWVDVYSELHHGATFKIYLPAAASVSTGEPQSVDQPLPRRTATILLVEDEAAIRMLLEDILSDAGHRVSSAVNGRAALQLIEQHPQQIDLLITDVVMPEMSGPELADQLSRSHPSMIVLYISGYTDSALLHRGAIEQGVAFLAKPFVPKSLLAKVDEMLHRNAATPHIS